MSPLAQLAPITTKGMHGGMTPPPPVKEKVKATADENDPMNRAFILGCEWTCQKLRDDEAFRTAANDVLASGAVSYDEDEEAANFGTNRTTRRPTSPTIKALARVVEDCLTAEMSGAQGKLLDMLRTLGESEAADTAGSVSASLTIRHEKVLRQELAEKLQLLEESKRRQLELQSRLEETRLTIQLFAQSSSSPYNLPAAALSTAGSPASPANNSYLYSGLQRSTPSTAPASPKHTLTLDENDGSPGGEFDSFLVADDCDGASSSRPDSPASSVQSSVQSSVLSSVQSSVQSTEQSASFSLQQPVHVPYEPSSSSGSEDGGEATDMQVKSDTASTGANTSAGASATSAESPPKVDIRERMRRRMKEKEGSNKLTSLAATANAVDTMATAAITTTEADAKDAAETVAMDKREILRRRMTTVRDSPPAKAKRLAPSLLPMPPTGESDTPTHVVAHAPVRPSTAERYWTPFLRIFIAENMECNLDDSGLETFLSPDRCVMWAAFQHCARVGDEGAAVYLASRLPIKQVRQVFKEAGLFRSAAQSQVERHTGFSSTQFDMEINKLAKSYTDPKDRLNMVEHQALSFANLCQLLAQVAQLVAPPLPNGSRSTAPLARAYVESCLRQYLLHQSIQTTYETMAADATRSMGGLVDSAMVAATPAASSRAETAELHTGDRKAVGGQSQAYGHHLRQLRAKQRSPACVSARVQGPRGGRGGAPAFSRELYVAIS
jgi:hypothetical protein